MTDSLKEYDEQNNDDIQINQKISEGINKKDISKVKQNAFEKTLRILSSFAMRKLGYARRVLEGKYNEKKENNCK